MTTPLLPEISWKEPNKTYYIDEKKINHKAHVQLLNMCMTVVGNNCTIIVNFQDTFYVYRSSKTLHVVPHKGQ